MILLHLIVRYGLRLLSGIAALGMIAIAAVEIAVPGAGHEGFERPGGVVLLAGIGIWLHALRRAAATRDELSRKLAQLEESTREQARSEERLRLAQAAAAIGIWEKDLATGTVTWSDSLRKLFGVDLESPAGTEELLDIVHPDDRASVARRIEAGRTDDDYEFEYRIRRPDGEIRWLQSRGRQVCDLDGTQTRALGVAIDISESKQAELTRSQLEQQLRNTERLETIGRLAGGVAHDFNNLLLAIRGYAEVGLKRLDETTATRDALTEILGVADRAAALTRQLLAFSRRQMLEPERLDLSAVVRDMQRFLRKTMGEDVELVVVSSATPVYVNADRSQLEQVIANLAINARDAMPCGGRLTLKVGSTTFGPDRGAEADSAFALLAVTDTGTGMAPEMTAKVFEPFFTTKAEGTGLGLATVHGIVEQSGGSIWVYSELGHGTTFKIYLPVADAASVVAPPEPVPAAPPAGGSETILLVEDDRRVRLLVAQMLESYGFEVVSALSGEEAIARIREGGTFDLLLTDLVMPRFGGREVAAAVRGLEPGIPVLLMSGYTDDDVVRRGLLEPGTAFVQKPFGSEELAVAVRRLLDEAFDRSTGSAVA